MLDSVKNDSFVGFNNSNKSNAAKWDATGSGDTSLESIGQLGSNFVQGLPTQEIADPMDYSAVDFSAEGEAFGQSGLGASSAQALSTDISRSMTSESNAWQGGLLGNEPAAASENLIAAPARARRANLTASQSASQSVLSQSQLDNATGTFVAGSNGKVQIDYLFDGSRKEGELAVFNLEGMGGLNRRAFAKEAAKRALSGGQDGQIVIKDQTEGAQFDGRLAEKSRNEGRTASTQTVSFAPGTRFGVMLVPRGTVADARKGGKLSLFSIPDLNPRGKSRLGEAATDEILELIKGAMLRIVS